MAEFGTFTTEEKDTALERRIEKKRRDRESAGSATWHSVAASPRSAAALLKNTEKGHALASSIVESCL